MARIEEEDHLSISAVPPCPIPPSKHTKGHPQRMPAFLTSTPVSCAARPHATVPSKKGRGQDTEEATEEAQDIEEQPPSPPATEQPQAKETQQAKEKPRATERPQAKKAASTSGYTNRRLLALNAKTREELESIVEKERYRTGKTCSFCRKNFATTKSKKNHVNYLRCKIVQQALDNIKKRVVGSVCPSQCVSQPADTCANSEPEEPHFDYEAMAAAGAHWEKHRKQREAAAASAEQEQLSSEDRGGEANTEPQLPRSTLVSIPDQGSVVFQRAKRARVEAAATNKSQSPGTV